MISAPLTHDLCPDPTAAATVIRLRAHTSRHVPRTQTRSLRHLCLDPFGRAADRNPHRTQGAPLGPGTLAPEIEMRTQDAVRRPASLAVEGGAAQGHFHGGARLD